MKYFNSVFITLFTLISCFGQVNVNPLGNGRYQYNSQLQSSNLHFYLFDDGYHSFEKDPVHEYNSLYLTNDATVYTGDPYDPSPPVKQVIHTVTQGNTNPAIPVYPRDNKVQLSESWNLVNSQENFYILMFTNIENPQPISGCIEFHFNANDNDVNGPDIKYHSFRNWADNQSFTTSDYPADFTHKFRWTFNNLALNEQRFIYIPASCLAEPLDIVKTRAVMKVNTCSGTIPAESTPDGNQAGVTQSPIYTLNSRVSNNPHDPNAIVADPGCLSRLPIIETVRYKIYFQNEGEIVEDVKVYFDVDMPIVNVQLVDASHSCVFYWSPEPNELNAPEPFFVDFENIFLPGLADSNMPEYDETVGWFEIDVCYNLKVFSTLGQDCVNTEAAIIFDDEDPIYAYNELCRNYIYPPFAAPLSCNPSPYTCPEKIYPIQDFYVPVEDEDQGKVTSTNEEELTEISVSPNPALNQIYLDNIKVDANTDIRIYNIANQLIKTLNLPMNSKSNAIDISDLQSGIYYIVVSQNKEVNTVKFVKQ